jgi:MtrB/PioB family decaheme-associated outer membrane protein
MKSFIFVIAALFTVTSSAAGQQTPPAASIPAGQDLPAVQQPVVLSGSVTPGVETSDSDTGSSKFTEYRDLRDAFFVPALQLNLFDSRSGGFANLRGTNLSRRDQSVAFSFGQVRLWDVQVDWNEIPHNFSNKAQTPYIHPTPGRLEVPTTVPITFKKLATAAGDTSGVLASDDLIAAYQLAFLHPAELRTQNNFGRVSFDLAPSDALRFSVEYDRIQKRGFMAGFGPIGDRPPRTLNIQLTEPVDNHTNDLTFAAEHQGSKYIAQFEYLFSSFANQIDTLVWENIYATAAPEATYDVWDRAVSTFGRKALPPDNRYHNLSFGIAGDLPMESRLSARVAYGRMEQNEPLLPYSYNSNVLVNPTLPRSSARAEIVTTQFLADYVVNPATRLNVRAWLRRFGMDNNTPEDRWQYVTSDTPNVNGTVSFVNKRINMPYATGRTQGGLEATYRLPARSSFVGGYERESLTREFREADTAEDRLTLSLRTRAARWANVRARYMLGNRTGDGYHGTVTREGYWYAPSEAGTDANNPQFTFDNHPDMRRFDVSDRRRNQFDVTLNLTPAETFSVSAAVRYRNDNFDSDVTSVQPLADTGVGEVAASTPGQQLGFLTMKRVQYSVDLFYLPAPRLTFNAFASRDSGKNRQRGLEFNENNKMNPSTIATAELGPWTRASNQWTADFDDVTFSGGVGATVQLVPERANLSLSYTASLADVDLQYGGYGVTNFDGAPFPSNHQFGFSANPPTVTEDLHVFDVRLEIPLVQHTTFLAGYSFERYRLDDWQQSGSESWYEQVGGEYLLRDTSRSFQWGNRLFNLGTPLAPAYDAHIGWVALRYRF